MFTGIIKGRGTVTAIEKSGGDVRLCIQCDELPFSSFEPGESISVNGVCLTATRLRDNGFDSDVSIETLKVTTLGELARGDAVNLEPALRLSDRLGGHLVSGHVDCVATVAACSADARSLRLTIEIPQEFARYVARKGSICIDGVSLTINEVSANVIDLNIIPHTAETTTIGDYRRGTMVNVEVDLLARYVERLLAGDAGELSMEFLRAHGYV